MPKIDVDETSVILLLQSALQVEKNAELAFTILACSAAALARDIGGLTLDQYLANCTEAWKVTPRGLVEPGEAKFDA